METVALAEDGTPGNPSTPSPYPYSDDAPAAIASGAGATPAVLPNGQQFRQGQKPHETYLYVGKRGDLSFYAHLAHGPVEGQTLARMMVGIYEEKIRRGALVDRESFVLVSVEAAAAEISDPWIAKLVASAAEPPDTPVQCSSLRLFGIRHMTFYAKPYEARYLLTGFLALCETVVDDGNLDVVEATWSDDSPAECRAFVTKNKGALRPLALHPFALLVAKLLDRRAYSSISWHPSARFIRHFDPEVYRE